MMSAPLDSIVRFLDKTLHCKEIKDWAGARNGLQLQNDGQVTRLAAAVDSHMGVIEEAVDRGVDLLIVHHGLFWSDVAPLTDAKYRKVRTAICHNLAVYGAHLPLDLHPKFGNNVLLAKALGLSVAKRQPFFQEKEQWIGCRFDVRIEREDLVNRLTKVLGAAPVVVPHGPTTIRKLGIVTGSAGDIDRAANEGVDTLITGEGANHTFGVARERGLNILYGGHYATETFGVKALANLVSERFEIPWQFIDIPTGL